MNARIPLLALSLATFVALPACIINVGTKTERTGRYVSSETLRQVEPGRSQDYVLALLGEPTSRTKLEPGGEVWKWSYTETKKREGRLIFVFSGDDTTSVQGAAYVEFQNGVVAKSWQD